MVWFFRRDSEAFAISCHGPCVRKSFTEPFIEASFRWRIKVAAYQNRHLSNSPHHVGPSRIVRPAVIQMRIKNGYFAAMDFDDRL